MANLILIATTLFVVAACNAQQGDVNVLAKAAIGTGAAAYRPN